MKKDDPSVRLYGARQRLARLRFWRWPHRLALVGCIIPSLLFSGFLTLGFLISSDSDWFEFFIILAIYSAPGYVLLKRRRKHLIASEKAEEEVDTLERTIRQSVHRNATEHGLSIVGDGETGGQLSLPTTSPPNGMDAPGDG